MMALLVLVAGCRMDMQDEPKFFPQRGTNFFPDHRSVRPQVPETVARGQLDQNQYFYTGLMNGKEADMLPFPVTMTVMERGQERFNIYCTPCHSRVGNGAGMIVDRGYLPAANFHEAHIKSEPLSHYFYVMTNGYGGMPDYKQQLTPADRWAVAAYIRALQLSQDATLADVPQGAQIHSLKEIASQEGYPESFAEPWTLPSTAVPVMREPGQGAPGNVPAYTGYHPAIPGGVFTPPAAGKNSGKKAPARPAAKTGAR